MNTLESQFLECLKKEIKKAWGLSILSTINIFIEAFLT